jgi:hypothetical protein
MNELADLAAEARRSGWAAGTLPLLEVRRQAHDLPWAEVPSRKGDAPVSVLRPTSAEDAHPRSLSATHGLGRQPLHTDGAHLKVPPHFAVLHAARPNGTPTLLWSHSSPLTSPQDPANPRPSGLGAGLFVVRSGKDRFLAAAHDYREGYRYDPGCMTPCDQRAREAVRYFESLIVNAHRHEWTEPDQVLVIDNRRALHARGAVGADDVDRELTRVAYTVAAKP